MRRHQSPKPMRRCIACRESKPQDELLRFTFKDGCVEADKDMKNDGRGIYLCRSKDCAETAVKRKAFNRVLRTNVNAENIERAIDEALGN